MNRYEEGMKLIEESCGNRKDNTIALSTIATGSGADGFPRPSVRDVSAYYEDGVFYVTTSAKSNKMQQIAHNKEVAFSVCFEGIYGHGIGENLGWVLEPQTAWKFLFHGAFSVFALGVVRTVIRIAAIAFFIF